MLYELYYALICLLISDITPPPPHLAPEKFGLTFCPWTLHNLKCLGKLALKKCSARRGKGPLKPFTERSCLYSQKRKGEGVREAAKKSFFLVAGPLRGGGRNGGATEEK